MELFEVPPGYHLSDFDGPRSETVLQTNAATALAAYGFVMLHFSQAQPTLTSLGIPDSMVIQPRRPIGDAFIEWKRPRILGIGRRKGSVIIRQAHGRRSFEQEEVYRAWVAAGVRICTADSLEYALAFLAHHGYDVPREAYRQPYDVRDQERFYDPNARPRATINAKRRINGYWNDVRAGRRPPPRRGGKALL